MKSIDDPAESPEVLLIMQSLMKLVRSNERYERRDEKGSREHAYIDNSSICDLNEFYNNCCFRLHYACFMPGILEGLDQSMPMKTSSSTQPSGKKAGPEITQYCAPGDTDP